jgi:hypothetical protein
LIPKLLLLLLYNVFPRGTVTCSNPATGQTQNVGANAMRHCILIILLGHLPYLSYGQLKYIINKVDNLEISIAPSMVTLHNENITSVNREIKIGYSVGVSGEFILNNKLSLITNISYERKGLKTQNKVWYYDPTIDYDDCKCTTSLGTYSTNSNLDYLTITIPLRLNLLNQKLLVEFGPYSGYLLKAKSTTTQHWNGVKYYTTDNIKKDFDFGISIGAGYKQKLGDKYTMTFILRDNIGLININDKNKTETVTKTSSLLLQIGLTLKLGTMK